MAYTTNTQPALRSLVHELPAYAAGRRATDATIAALASNESHYDPLPSVLDVVDTAARRMNRYPDSAALALRTGIAAALGVVPEEVVVGPGSLGVLQQIIAAVCDPGDEIVFAWRSFEAYPVLASLAAARSVMVPLAADESHDLEAMAAAVTERTKVILVCTPNNPTGATVKHGRMSEFLDSVPAHVLVVIDEAYVEFVAEKEALDALALFRAHPNVCVLRTFSKAHGLAGLRVGFAVAHTELADGLRRVGLPFAVTALAQEAALASLQATRELHERVALVVAERDRVADALRRAGWAVIAGQANFVWLRADDTLRELIVDHLERNDILVRGYRGDGVRISLADGPTNDHVIAALGDRSSFEAAR
ncbi:histidinol-phosphate transaminase [Antribacter sp. KLBMP9083]|uniref:Aromatic amino acid aminotransferase n=1 Tax=Antribacter soli TaxID=2910976 RepID=A0AA41QDW3_9MICO|nr:histidinol-phosphate transaminase [Antribacter soli]MCF4121346.1 histidinol-phosphate transaminase [Antribacter soli]